jgi:hypothetical protein
VDVGVGVGVGVGVDVHVSREVSDLLFFERFFLFVLVARARLRVVF